MLEPFFVWADFKNEKVLRKVDPLQVTRLFTKKNYTTIYLDNEKSYAVRISLVNALKYFPPKMFVRIGRGEAVSVLFIDDIAKDHLILKGKPVSIHRAYFKYVLDGINILE